MSIKNLIEQIKRQNEIKTVEPDELKKTKQIILKGLEDLRLSPPNKTIRELLVNFLAMTKHEAQKTGLFLSGGTGTGKTTALKIIAGYRDYKVFYADELVSRYRAKGDSMMYSELFNGAKNIIIDDIGCEPTLFIYGMKFELIEQLIIERHRQFINHGHLTLFSTNLSKEDFITRYGHRIYSRLVEMCEIVPCNGDDLRIKKER